MISESATLDQIKQVVDVLIDAQALVGSRSCELCEYEKTISCCNCSSGIALAIKREIDLKIAGSDKK